MMSHFNWKSLSFYGAAIVAVVLLFRGVTAYGKANLNAPPKIDGRYRLSAQNLPDCLKSNTLLLNIQQSGVYLNGSLLPEGNNAQLETRAQEKPSLTGRFIHPQVSLMGSVPLLSNCRTLTQQANASGHPLWVKIQGVVQGETLTGKISLSSTPTAAEFTAQREAQKEKQEL